MAICLFLLAGSGAHASAAVYSVKSGDCLWTISNSSGVSVSTIKQLNWLSSDFLSIGQVLQLGGDPAPVAEPALVVAAAPSPAVATAPAAGVSTYVVCAGDNLWSIAQRFGTSVEAIKAGSGLNSDRLQIGQSLIINGTAVTQAASPTVSRSGNSATGARVVEKAAQYLGVPYMYGGSTAAGFDCSGFSQYIFSQFQISLNRTAASQYSNGYGVSKGELIPGDLVFFDCSGGNGISHVGIYSGNGNFIHSSSPRSGGVIYSSLNTGYYADTYVGARRVIR
ncbi:MAG: NlpC/P60 family protein [Firmicutes bacterium]|nr:NlpC/P60 family protein [Bacillota bacterium]